MMNSDEMPCPICAETIKRNATVCRFCSAKSVFGTWLRAQQRPNSFQSCMGCVGFVIVAMFLISWLGS